jgi:hypothetical protein
MSAIEFEITDRTTMKEYVMRKLAIQKANRCEAERPAGPSAAVVPFPAIRQRRLADLKGEHLYRRSEGLREWKRYLKQLGVAPDKIAADIAELAVAIGFSKYRG